MGRRLASGEESGCCRQGVGELRSVDDMHGVAGSIHSEDGRDVLCDIDQLMTLDALHDIGQIGINDNCLA